MWYFSAAGAPENGQNVISVEKSVLDFAPRGRARTQLGFVVQYKKFRLQCGQVAPT